MFEEPAPGREAKIVSVSLKVATCCNEPDVHTVGIAVRVEVRVVYEMVTTMTGWLGVSGLVMREGPRPTFMGTEIPKDTDAFMDMVDATVDYILAHIEDEGR